MSTLKLKGSTSGEAEVTVVAAAGTPTITLPTADINLATDGSDGQYLKTNGSGTLSFDTPTTDKIQEGNTSVECIDTDGSTDDKIILTQGGNERLRIGNGAAAGIYIDNGNPLQWGLAGQTLLISGTTQGTNSIKSQYGNIEFTAQGVNNNTSTIHDLLKLVHSPGAGTTATKVELYASDTKRLETSTTGVTITGDVDPAADSSHDLGSSGVRWANGYFDTLYGDGSNLTGISAGAALTGSTDNTVVTVTGANAMQGEANLTFNGSQLDLDTGSGTFNRWKTDQLRFNCTGDAHIDHYTVGQKFKFRTSASSGADTTCLEIFSTGDVEVSSGNLVIGTDGKGIDFSASGDSNATGESQDSEILDDYEEGEWDITPNNNNLTFTNPTCKYTKIGNLVTVVGQIVVSAVSGSDPTYLELPFSCANYAAHGNTSGCAMIHRSIDAGGDTCGIVIPGNTPWCWLFGSNNDGVWRHISNAHLNTSSEMFFNLSYRTTA